MAAIILWNIPNMLFRKFALAVVALCVGRQTVSAAPLQLDARVPTFALAPLLEDRTCASRQCRLSQAAAAAALGDYGRYARIMTTGDMPEFARSKGIVQNFDTIALFRPLAITSPDHITERFALPFANAAALQTAAGPDNLTAEGRPILELQVNDITT